MGLIGEQVIFKEKVDHFFVILSRSPTLTLKSSLRFHSISSLIVVLYCRAML